MLTHLCRNFFVTLTMENPVGRGSDRATFVAVPVAHR